MKKSNIWLRMAEMNEDRLVYGKDHEEELENNLEYVSRRILEIGCGEGRNLSFLLRRGFDAYGFDTSEKMIKKAIKFRKINPKRLMIGEISNLSFPVPFDTLICIDLFHHLTNLKGFIHKIKNEIKSGGYLLFNIFSMFEPTYTGKKEEYLGGLYFRYFTKKDISLLLNPDFDIVKCYRYKRIDSPHPGYSFRTKKHIHDYWFVVAKRK